MPQSGPDNKSIWKIDCYFIFFLCMYIGMYVSENVLFDIHEKNEIIEI